MGLRRKFKVIAVVSGILGTVVLYAMLPTPVCQLWMSVDESMEVMASSFHFPIGDCSHDGIKIVFDRAGTNGTAYYPYCEPPITYWRKVPYPVYKRNGWWYVDSPFGEYKIMAASIAD